MNVKDIRKAKARRIQCVRAGKPVATLRRKLGMERVGALAVSGDYSMIPAT